MARRKGPVSQLALFPGADPAVEAAYGVNAAEPSPDLVDLGRRLHPEIRLGPSTWSFPGWAGIVYDKEYPTGRLSREGLPAVARHPLLRAAGIDRTHYAPVPPAELAVYAEQVPRSFRFLVKAHELCTLAHFPDRPRYGAQRGLGNPLFLDAAYAAEQVVAPTREGLGGTLGAILFQFAPQDLGVPRRFAEELHAFLAALPRDVLYAVELRNRELLTPDYAGALAAAGAVHCLNAHPRMPDVAVQLQRAHPTGDFPALVVRWLLGQGDRYEDAGRRFAPFDRLQAEDPPVRRTLATLARTAARRNRPVLITVNNNAEGSAPLSIARLAAEIVSG
jgi:uncharacterized protein YecE (DUF72 family)